MRRVLLFVLLLASSALPASATTYFISALGSDSNNCTSSGTACATFAHIETLATTGDTIKVVAADGTLRINSGHSSTSGSISAKDNQIFDSTAACTPTVGPTKCTGVISGGIVLSGFSGPDGNGDWSIGGQTQAGTVQTNSCDTGWEACNYPEDVFYDAAPLKHICHLTAGACDNTRPTLATGQFWFDYVNDIIYIHDTPSGHTVETSVLQAPFANSGANGVTIQNLTITEFATPNKNGAIDPFKGGNVGATTNLNWTLQNSYIVNNHGTGVRPAYGMQVLNNVSTSNGVQGMGGGLTVAGVPSGVLIQGNTVTLNNYAHQAPGQGAGGIKFGQTLAMTIRNNTVSNNIGNGIHFDDLSSGNLVDGNTVEHNTDACCTNTNGITDEIGSASLGNTTFRNNVSRYNGDAGNGGFDIQISSASGSSVDNYCNVIEVSNTAHQQTWNVNAGNRVFNGQQMISVGNAVHHNTVIFDSGAGATGITGYQLSDAAHQPNFFALNSVPYANTYHMNPTSGAIFKYDNDSSQANTSKTFGPGAGTYQASTGTPPTGINLGPDITATGGSIDTVNTSGWPTVSITSPADQGNFASSVPVTVTASDGSGISKVEFYLDWVLQSTVNNPGPYNSTISSIAAGTHTLAAMAYSTAGVRACNALTVNASGISAAGATQMLNGAALGNGAVAK